MKKLLLSLFLFLANYAFANENLAIVIANEWYADESLSGAGSDGLKVSNALTSNGYETVLLKNVNKKEILENISSVLEKNKKIKNVIVFYTGHGVELSDDGFFWLPVESSIQGLTKENVKKDGISLIYINKLMKSKNIENVFIFNDACRIYTKDELNKVSKSKVDIGIKVKGILLNSFSTSKDMTAMDTNILTGESGSVYADIFTNSILNKKAVGLILEDMELNVLNKSQKVENIWLSNQLNDFVIYSKETGKIKVFDGMSKWK